MSNLALKSYVSITTNQVSKTDPPRPYIRGGKKYIKIDKWQKGVNNNSTISQVTNNYNISLDELKQYNQIYKYANDPDMRNNGAYPLFEKGGDIQLVAGAELCLGPVKQPIPSKIVSIHPDYQVNTNGLSNTSDKLAINTTSETSITAEISFIDDTSALKNTLINFMKNAVYNHPTRGDIKVNEKNWNHATLEQLAEYTIDATNGEGEKAKLLMAIAGVESKFDYQAISSANACGLCQVKPNSVGFSASALLNPKTNLSVANTYFFETLGEELQQLTNGAFNQLSEDEQQTLLLLSYKEGSTGATNLLKYTSNGKQKSYNLSTQLARFEAGISDCFKALDLQHKANRSRGYLNKVQYLLDQFSNIAMPGR